MDWHIAITRACGRDKSGPYSAAALGQPAPAGL